LKLTGTDDQTKARQKIAHGQQGFNTVKFNITGVAGLNVEREDIRIEATSERIVHKTREILDRCGEARGPPGGTVFVKGTRFIIGCLRGHDALALGNAGALVLGERVCASLERNNLLLL
jgi:hypothetical protein